MQARQIKPLRRIAEAHSQRVAKQLAHCQDELRAAQNRLSELEQYRDEYSRQLGEGSPNARLLQNRRQFLERLNDAVEAQRKLIESLQGDYSARQDDMADAGREQKTMDRLISHCEARENAAREKLQQCELDEIASGRGFDLGR